MRKAKKLKFVHFDFCYVDVVETEKEMEMVLKKRLLFVNVRQRLHIDVGLRERDLNAILV